MQFIVVKLLLLQFVVIFGFRLTFHPFHRTLLCVGLLDHCVPYSKNYFPILIRISHIENDVPVHCLFTNQLFYKILFVLVIISWEFNGTETTTKNLNFVRVFSQACNKIWLWSYSYISREKMNANPNGC